jgi:hypothetical protein
MSVARRRSPFVVLLTLLPFIGCLPYTVGSSAQTVPANESTRSVSSYFAPKAVKLDDSVAAPMFGVDVEWRHGLDTHSDVAFRVLSEGAMVNYNTGSAPTRATPEPRGRSSSAVGSSIGVSTH